MKEIADEFIREAAEELEQFMYERGEYDFRNDDRIRWLDGIENEDTFGAARNKVTDNIRKSLQTEDGRKIYHDKSVIERD